MQRRSWWSVGRRFAAGIDVNRRTVRIAVLSRRARGGAVRLEALDAEPLPAGAFDEPADADWAAVAAAMAAALGRVPPMRPAGWVRRTMAGVMALPAGAFSSATLAWPRADAAAAVEPAVRAAAERLTGLARDALAVDWCVNDGGAASELVFATAAHVHLDVRIEAAASAGVELVAIDGEPPAALRAIRHVAAREVDSGEPYLGVWIGESGVHGWLVSADAVAAQIRYPAPEHADLADALRELARAGAPRCAFVAGDPEWLGGARISLADVGDLLGCIVLPFECAACGPLGAVDDGLAHSPGFAVAFGLALRGVFE
ncbi:type IV pilus biogenesis protein PilM [Burkholderia pseudomallei]|uniref:Competence protein ComA n=3 Tax=Burkholderia pseudomallei TaxID=28450 RepID=A0AAX0U4Q0_BURPE|nr:MULTISPECIES: pilus assembly protein PilM [Burkholderia]ABN91809.1 conserved hypothetical protein [Burkholderia pseudomallei 1106a]AFR17647.1 hypothetical protein BPC006_I3814 [Burkholderia pseudomallei BPC006]AIO12690.1 hypothetical protein DP58_1782 [Burkholderia pseudomallei]AIO88910.1 hypothetical protein DP48_231 [Burkholderia pseudomallei]ANW51665.1 hypothetical protein A7U58_17215 [Burkholderia pseudomallei]